MTQTTQTGPRLLAQDMKRAIREPEGARFVAGLLIAARTEDLYTVGKYLGGSRRYELERLVDAELAQR